MRTKKRPPGMYIWWLYEGALQRTGGALRVRYGSLTHPESHRGQQHPQGCVAGFTL